MTSSQKELNYAKEYELLDEVKKASVSTDVTRIQDSVEDAAGSDHYELRLSPLTDDSNSGSPVLSTAATVGSNLPANQPKKLDPFEDDGIEPIRWEKGEAASSSAVADIVEEIVSTASYCIDDQADNYDILPLLDGPEIAFQDTPKIDSVRDYAALPDTMISEELTLPAPESASSSSATATVVSGGKKKKSNSAFAAPARTVIKGKEKPLVKGRASGGLVKKKQLISKEASSSPSSSQNSTLPLEVSRLKGNLDTLGSDLEEAKKQLSQALQEKERLGQRIEYLNESLEKERSISNDLTDQVTRLLQAGGQHNEDPNYNALKSIPSLTEKETIIAAYSPGQVHNLALEIKEQETLMRGYQRENENQIKEIKGLKATVADMEGSHLKIVEEKQTEIAILKTKILELENMAVASGESKVLVELKRQLKGLQESLAVTTVENENLQAELSVTRDELLRLKNDIGKHAVPSDGGASAWKEREKQLLLDLMNERKKRDEAEKKLLAYAIESKAPVIPEPVADAEQFEPAVIMAEIIDDVIDNVVSGEPHNEKDSQPLESSSEAISYANVVSKSPRNPKGTGSKKSVAKGSTKKMPVSKSSEDQGSAKASEKEEIRKIQAASVKTEKSLLEMIDKLKADNQQITKEKSGLLLEKSELERLNNEWSWEVKKLNQSIPARINAIKEKMKCIDPHVIFNSLSLSIISFQSVVEQRVVRKMTALRNQARQAVGDSQNYIAQLEDSKVEMLNRHQKEAETSFTRINELERELRLFREKEKETADAAQSASEARLDLERQRQLNISLKEEMARMESRYKEMHENTVKILRQAQEESTKLILSERQGSGTSQSQEDSLALVEKLRQELQEWRDQSVQWRQKYEDAMHWLENRDIPVKKTDILQADSFPVPWMEQIKSLQESNQQLTLALSKVTTLASTTQHLHHQQQQPPIVQTGSNQQPQVSSLSISLLKSSYEQMIKSLRKEHDIEMKWKDDQIRAFREELDGLVSSLKMQQMKLLSAIPSSGMFNK